MGKPNPHRTLKGNWTIEVEKDLVAMYDCDISDEIMRSLGEELAGKIDEEIVEQLEKVNLTIERKKLI